MGDKAKYVVGLGASAGGLEALEHFFDHLPTDSKCAFIVVMHLSRDFKSMLDELLARHTGMKVEAARNGIELQAKTVYVIQPKTTVEVDGLRLAVSTRPSVNPTGAATSIDTLFKSIATYWGASGAAVVLSGSGSDGAKGIEAVRNAGGFTCAQSPETAKFDSMPLAAIATNCVNAVEAPEQLGQISIDGLLLPSISKDMNILSDQDTAMKKIVDAVVGASDLDARQYKHSTFERRVQRRMMDLQIKSLADYAERVATEKDEAETLADALLIGVTDFFRDNEPFEIIKHQIISEVIKHAHESERPIRIWSPGCATGEEAYSLAMLFSEALRDMPFKIELQIFATDISRKHLNEAGRGEYSNERVKNIPKNFLEKYFTPAENNESWVVLPELRKMIVFAPHDLLSDPPFTKLDMITCRNILIYFSIEAQQRILGGFSFGLRERGFLFLGASETVGGQRDAFEFIDARNRIFRRTNTRNNNTIAKTRGLYPLTSITSRPHNSSKSRESELQPAYAAMLREYAPASLLVSSDRQLLHSFGNATQYIRTPEGLANLDVTEMVDSALKTPLIAALERALHDRKALSFSRIKIESYPEVGRMVDLTVKPLMSDKDERPRQSLVIIDSKPYEGDEDVIDLVPAYSSDELVQTRISELEQELDRTREALQSTIEEIETANEELQASNEQLMSANEELQSTNEELSSVNEELHSVNSEYHRQNDDLTQLTGDFDLLLNATSVGVLFLDHAGIITRYTGLIGKLYHLTDNDIGRSFSNFRSPFQDLNPETLRQQADSEQVALEVETVHEDGTTWLVRTVSNAINFGSVITFINISKLRNAEEKARITRTMLEAIRRTTKAFYLEVDADITKLHNQIGYDEYVGSTIESFPYILPFTNIHKDDFAIIDGVKEHMTREEKAEFVFRLWNQEREDHCYVRAAARRMDDGRIQVTGYDIDDFCRNELEAIKQKSILDATLSVSRTFKAYIDGDHIYQYVNDAYCKQFDLIKEDILGKKVSDVMGADFSKLYNERLKEVRKKGSVQFNAEYLIDGNLTMLSVQYRNVSDNKDDNLGVVIDGLDISKVIDYGQYLDAMDRVICIATRQSSQALLVVDTDTGLIDFVNEAALKRLGSTTENFKPETVHVSRLTTEWGENKWSEYLKSIVGKQNSIENDVSVFSGSSSTEKADIFAEVIAIEGKKTKAVLKVHEDSDKERLLDDLRSRSQQLAISNRDLEQFTSVVAHDLRSPLRHISQFAQMLDKSVDQMNQEDLRKQSQIIGSSAKHLSDMVNGLLDYARVGRAQKDFKPCDLQQIIDTAMQYLDTEIEESGADIIVNETVPILGDSNLLVRLFQNLIGNAIKYSKVDTPLKIIIEAKENKNSVDISISDNGIGIDPEFAERIFELFKRLHADSEYIGLGIGLATCRRIVELHDAKITLDKTFITGSRFQIHNFSKANIETDDKRKIN